MSSQVLALRAFDMGERLNVLVGNLGFVGRERIFIMSGSHVD